MECVQRNMSSFCCIGIVMLEIVACMLGEWECKELGMYIHFRVNNIVMHMGSELLKNMARNV